MPSHISVVRPASRTAQLFGFLWTLVRTDFKARYHGSLQGFFWALLKPLIMFVALMVVFSFIFGADPNYSVNLIIGLFLWDFFADATKTGLISLQVKGYLLTKARLPPWIFVMSSTSNAIITLVVFTLVLMVYMALVGRLPSPAHVLLFVAYLVHYYAMVVGISLATSVLFLKYRDLNQVWDVVIQAGFFIAPIIYPLRILPEHVHKYLYFWPPTPIIQFSRAVLVDGVAPTLRGHVYLTVGTGVILACGTAIFLSRAARAAEDL